MAESLRERLQSMTGFYGNGGARNMATVREAADALAAITAERDEARRRRDEWRKKAEGYDEVRKALREQVGAPWPPSLSRALWAGIAADEKKRADTAEAERDRLAEALRKADAERDEIIRATQASGYCHCAVCNAIREPREP